MIYYELRCCCQPENLIGWLPAPAGLRPGWRWSFVLRGGPRLRFDAGERRYTWRPEELRLEVALYECRQERLWPDDPHPSAPLIESWQHAYPAFSSHDLPRDVFARIAGFRARDELQVHTSAFFPAP